VPLALRAAPPGWYRIVNRVPVPLQLALSVSVPGPPPASFALTCSSTAWVSMVAEVSILLRPLLPIAMNNNPMIDSMPTMSTTAAIANSMSVRQAKHLLPSTACCVSCI